MFSWNFDKITLIFPDHVSVTNLFCFLLFHVSLRTHTIWFLFLLWLTWEVAFELINHNASLELVNRINGPFSRFYLSMFTYLCIKCVFTTNMFFFQFRWPYRFVHSDTFFWDWYICFLPSRFIYPATLAFLIFLLIASLYLVFDYGNFVWKS